MRGKKNPQQGVGEVSDEMLQKGFICLPSTPSKWNGERWSLRYKVEEAKASFTKLKLWDLCRLPSVVIRRPVEEGSDGVAWWAPGVQPRSTTLCISILLRVSETCWEYVETINYITCRLTVLRYIHYMWFLLKALPSVPSDLQLLP